MSFNNNENNFLFAQHHQCMHLKFHCGLYQRAIILNIVYETNYFGQAHIPLMEDCVPLYLKKKSVVQLKLWSKTTTIFYFLLFKTCYGLI